MLNQVETIGIVDGLQLSVLNVGVRGQRTSFSASYRGQQLQAVSYGHDVKLLLAGVSRGAKSFPFNYADNSSQIAGVASSYQDNQVLNPFEVSLGGQFCDDLVVGMQKDEKIISQKLSRHLKGFLGYTGKRLDSWIAKQNCCRWKYIMR